MFVPFVFQIAAGTQHCIVEYLDGVQTQVAELKRLQVGSAAELERLSGAVLKQAFEGRLVPQDPDDEPASVLLERIRAAREARATGEEKRKTQQMRLPTM